VNLIFLVADIDRCLLDKAVKVLETIKPMHWGCKQCMA
jgi:hypothetical protein